MAVKNSGVWPVVILASAFSFGAEFWETRSYEEWSPKECRWMLDESPWVKIYSFARTNAPGPTWSRVMTEVKDIESAESQDTPVQFGSSSAPDREVFNILRIRLATAKPIRMAAGRLRMLSDPENRQLAEQVRNYAEGPSPDQIALEMTYYSKPEGHDSVREIESFLRQMTLPLLAGTTYLSVSGRDTHISLDSYTPPGKGSPSAVFFFPRFDEAGLPYFSGDEDQIVFHVEIDLSRIGEARKHVVELELDPKALIFQSRLEL